MATTTASAPVGGPSSIPGPVLPRDARLVALLLAASGAEDSEEGVVRMLTEFAHRYTTDILTDALAYSDHAKGPQATLAQALAGPSLDDVRLAVQARIEGTQPTKEFLLSLASSVNSAPLPPIPETYGLRLPPRKDRLTAPNYRILPRAEPTQQDAADAVAGAQELLDTLGGAGAGAQADDGGGLFGDDDDDEDDDEEDEEMEDLTGGFPGGNGTMNGKRKADELDEEYD